VVLAGVSIWVAEPQRIARNGGQGLRGPAL